MNYDILLFDADNTLFDFTACEARAFARTMRDFDIELKDGMTQTYSRYNDRCWKELERGELTKGELVVKRYALFLDHYGVDCDPVKVNAVYERNLSETAILFPGAEEMLERLCRKARIYVITNGLTQVQLGRFSRTRLGNYIEKIFISEQMGCKKPDALFFERATREIPGFSKERALVIGDSLTSDIQGANNYGLECVWYNPSGERAPGDLHITATVKNFTELEAFLKEGEG